jgi:hypothetical protein
MSEPDPDGYRSDPGDEVDTTEFEVGGLRSRRGPSRWPGSASPVKLLARLAGVAALVFAVVAIFLLRPTGSRDKADNVSMSARAAAASGRAPSPSPSYSRARSARLRRHVRHQGGADRVLLAGTNPDGHPAPAWPAQPSQPAGRAVRVEVGGEVTCLSGQSVEGVWLQAAAHPGFAPWQGVQVRGKAFGSTSKWWWWLPGGESYSLKVGCGGTQVSWGVVTSTAVVTGTQNSFDCIDIASDTGYGTCYDA